MRYIWKNIKDPVFFWTR